MTNCHHCMPVQKKKKAGGGAGGGVGGAQSPQLDPAARKEGERRFQASSIPAAQWQRDASANEQSP